ncbi:MAG: hypothetical protein FWG20_02455 [Candidatus Cloacimonetes bacterium]|nr:hypothetical protein [Candidatus Cloacimonadota bacterium]
MQDRYIKDLALSLGVIILIIFGIRVYYLYAKVSKVQEHSIYSQRALSPELLDQIAQIEDSIKERKNYRFTVRRDPLKQDLIVQTRLDLLKEWEEKVKRMMRLTAIIGEDENQRAIIEWNAKSNVVAVGDVLNNKRITRIGVNEVDYIENGIKGTFVPQPVPPKPVQLDRGRSTSNRGNR